MNWSLYIYLLAIVEIAIAVAVRGGEFSDSSFFGEEGRDICRLVFCRHLSLDKMFSISSRSHAKL